ncbi:MAG: endopeptidase La [Patescibacteria group bacterium]|nr:endopeptidase La [Patescibacteria group bacterium]
MVILLGSSSQNKPLPLVPIRDGVVFPHTETVLTFGRSKSVSAMDAAFSQDRLIVFALQKNTRANDPKTEEINSKGTLCQIERMIRDEAGNNVNALVKGLARVEIEQFESDQPYFLVKIKEINEIKDESDEVIALSKHITQLFRTAANLGKQIDFLTFMNIVAGLLPGELADQVASTLDVKPEQKQELLEITNIKERLLKVNELLTHEVRVLELEKKISSKTQERFDKSMREAMLRERMKAIEKELGEGDENKEIKELRDNLKKLGMPKDIEEKIDKEIKRLEQMSAYNPEASYLRTYLDWILALPWNVKSPNNVDINDAEKTLNKDHYGLEKIKDRILEYLAVLKLHQQREHEEEQNASGDKQNGEAAKTENIVRPNQEGKQKMATILCFVGPPGVGKTSIGKSIAKALGRKFVKMSLGGIRDEAEIRGHRRTYVGALPGRIIQGIRQAGTKNPVFMLDEIDKVGTDFRGDPSSALLEALDPEQNYAFSDHYLEVPFDLSSVMFITTCNVLDTIPPALRDRLEIIHFPGYTQEEKFHIAGGYLWKKQKDAHGLDNNELTVTNNGIREIINRYTREAGVRNLERELAAICRKVAKNIARGKKRKVKITPRNLHKYLGPRKFSETLAEKKDEVGMSTGLAWTEAGGDVLFIEVALMPGKGSLLLTGQLGEVMQESCKAAVSYVRSHYKLFKLPEKFYQKIDIHVHVPEGAVPKDGPSAGVAIATALVSALTKNPTKRDVGMTGEITLRGRVLEIGGVKEKVIAAHRAGLKTVILPKENEKDLEDIPKNIRKSIKFVFASQVEEVLKNALKNPIDKK